MAIFVRHLLIMDLAGCELLGVLHLGLSLCKAARGLVYCGLGWGGGITGLGLMRGTSLLHVISHMARLSRDRLYTSFFPTAN